MCTFNKDMSWKCCEHLGDPDSALLDTLTVAMASFLFSAKHKSLPCVVLCEKCCLTQYAAFFTDIQVFFFKPNFWK